MKMILMLTIMVTIFTSCRTTIPYDVRDVTGEIADRRYELHTYDCSNKAFDLTCALINRGYDARIYAYHTTGGTIGHAIVEVVIEGTILYLDPTKKRGYERVAKPFVKPMAIWVPMQLMHLGNPSNVELWLEDYLLHLIPME